MFDIISRCLSCFLTSLQPLFLTFFQPLFLTVTFNAVHVGNSYNPLEAPYEYVRRMSHIADPNRRKYAGMDKHSGSQHRGKYAYLCGQTNKKITLWSSVGKTANGYSVQTVLCQYRRNSIDKTISSLRVQ